MRCSIGSLQPKSSDSFQLTQHLLLISLPLSRLGKIFRDRLKAVKSPMIDIVRGKGLLNAVVIKPYKGKTAWDVCMLMRDRGVLAKPTHDDIIRFAPPLVSASKEQKERRCVIGVGRVDDSAAILSDMLPVCLFSQVITEAELNEATDIIIDTIKAFE